MANNPSIKIDPAGDLDLHLTSHDGPTVFQVSSKAMSLASPVWRTMLDPKGPFRESKPNNGEVTFEDDDANALMILLLAAHLRFQELPQTLKYPQLLDLCVACDKYDCIELVRPWVPGWESSLKSLADKAGYEERLFIAWLLEMLPDSSG